MSVFVVAGINENFVVGEVKVMVHLCVDLVNISCPKDTVVSSNVAQKVHCKTNEVWSISIVFRVN